MTSASLARVCLLIGLGLATGATADAEEDFQVGFATADITPPVGWRRAGSYTESISTGTHDPLYAKAMRLSEGTTTVALVGNDLTSVPRELTDRARQRASERTGIPAANIIITATHTHGGAEYYGPLRDFLHARALKENNGTDPREPLDYHALLVNRWTEVIGKAHAALPFARPVPGGQLAMRSATIYSPVTPVTEAEYAAATKLMENLDRADAPFLTTVDAWRKILRHELWQKFAGKLPQEIQAIRLDRDTAIVTLPHEVMVELGLAIKSASPFRTTIVSSLANDLDFYIPTRRALEEGHYEPTTCPLEPGCGELPTRAAVNLLNELKP